MAGASCDLHELAGNNGDFQVIALPAKIAVRREKNALRGERKRDREM